MTDRQGAFDLQTPRPRDAVCIRRDVVMETANRMERLHNLPTIAATLRDRCAGVPDGECCWVQEAVAERYGMTVDD